MRRANARVTITITMTHAQRETMGRLRGNKSQAGYIRALIAEDASRQGECFSDESTPYKLAARAGAATPRMRE
jgi:hypothetical protein